MIRFPAWVLPAAACAFAAGCSRPQPPAERASTAAPEPPKITQFYATAPHLARGEKELLCYGVEGAGAVWLEPPRQQLSAALSRCVDVNPSATTTFKLTAEGSGGPPAVQELIVTVDVSSLNVAPGAAVSICYKVENARQVEIAPIHFLGGARSDACAMVQPKTTTTYTVTASGAEGDRDQEHVTIHVK